MNTMNTIEITERIAKGEQSPHLQGGTNMKNYTWHKSCYNPLNCTGVAMMKHLLNHPLFSRVIGFKNTKTQEEVQARFNYICHSFPGTPIIEWWKASKYISKETGFDIRLMPSRVYNKA